MPKPIMSLVASHRCCPGRQNRCSAVLIFFLNFNKIVFMICALFRSLLYLYCTYGRCAIVDSDINKCLWQKHLTLLSSRVYRYVSIVSLQYLLIWCVFLHQPYHINTPANLLHNFVTYCYLSVLVLVVFKVNIGYSSTASLFLTILILIVKIYAIIEYNFLERSLNHQRTISTL